MEKSCPGNSGELSHAGHTELTCSKTIAVQSWLTQFGIGERKVDRFEDKARLVTFVCEQNIHRYERLLKTKLTPLERDYIERRIAEERHSLQHNKLNSMAKGFVAAILSSELLFLDFDLIGQIAPI